MHDYLPGLPMRSVAIDVGLVQRDSLHEDLPATARALERFTSEDFVDQLAADLAGAGFDAVVVDIAPAALEAARRAGVPALAVGNFDWAWIYAQTRGLEAFAERFLTWQAPHRALRITPGPPLTGFASVEDVGVLGRWRAPTRPSGVGDEQLVLVSFGGLGLDRLDELLPEVRGVRWLLAPPMAPLPRADCAFVQGTTYPALVGGADRVLTKPGYGIYAEAALAGTPVIVVPRPGFPEAAFLTPAFAARGDALLEPGDLASLRAQLRAAVSRPAPRPPRQARGAAARIAARALDLTSGSAGA